MVATMRKEMVEQRAKRGVGARLKLTTSEAERRAVRQVRRDVAVRVLRRFAARRPRALPNAESTTLPENSDCSQDCSQNKTTPLRSLLLSSLNPFSLPLTLR